MRPTTMAGPEVRIERLRPMRVAWVRSVGTSPEQDAWRLLSAWAGPAGLLADPVGHPVFGFNNPAAAPGVPEYGYEFWLAVDVDTQPPASIGVKDFDGGLYAIASCHLGPAMPEVWKALLRWVHASQFRWRRTTHELERLVNPMAPPDAMTVELCLPVEE
jgi:DNA gyrase inhibitor GyrI